MPRKPLSGFGVEVEVSKQLVVHPEKVIITLTVFNGTQQPVKLNFQEQPPRDIVVKDKEGKEVWRWSHRQVFPQVVPPSVTVTKKKPYVFERSWNLEDNNGTPVGMGTYSVEGVVKSKPCAMTATTTLEIGAKLLKK